MQSALTGKTAVVTGSSGGIGRAIALELAEAGAHVLIHCRASSSAAEEVADAIRRQDCEAAVEQADLTDHATLAPLVERAWSWRGGIDIWINNAGGDVLTGEAAEWSFEDKLEYLWRVEVRGTACLCRLVGPRMQAAYRGGDRPVILNMGWDQAEQGMGGDSGELFATVKGAVMAFTRSLAHSLAPEVRVNCLAPGWIRTAWGRRASDVWQKRARDESLLNRWGTPEDVARVARFLASPAADFVNAHIIPINGGFRHG
jgi:3-oxoacyl-[acyl-carrier protein] reductase